jgi:hypothetical protein
LTKDSTVTKVSNTQVKAVLLELTSSIADSRIVVVFQPGEYIFDFFAQFNVNFETCPLVLNMIEEIIEVAHGGDDSQRAASKLDTMLSFLGTIFRSKEQHLKVSCVAVSCSNL